MGEVGAYVSIEAISSKGENFYKGLFSIADYPEWDQKILDKCLWCANFCSNQVKRRPLSRSLRQDIEEGIYLGPWPLAEYEIRGGHRVFNFVCKPDGETSQTIENPDLCECFESLAGKSPRLIALLGLCGGENNGR